MRFAAKERDWSGVVHIIFYIYNVAQPKQGQVHIWIWCVTI